MTMLRERDSITTLEETSPLKTSRTHLIISVMNQTCKCIESGLQEQVPRVSLQVRREDFQKA